MNFANIGVIALALFASSQASAVGTEVRVQATSIGWYKASGTHQAFNPNTLTGVLAGVEYRSFYVWNLPSFEGIVDSARIEFDLQYSLGVSGSSTQNGTVYDVTQSNVSSLPLNNGGAQGENIFGDLGSGSQLGGFTIRPSDALTVFQVALNSNAIESLNSLSGGTFAVGIRNTTPGNTGNYFLFSSGSFPSTQTLVLSISPVPEPSSLLLLTLGTAALFARARVGSTKGR